MWHPWSILLFCFGYGCLILINLLLFLFSTSLVGCYIEKRGNSCICRDKEEKIKIEGKIQEVLIKDIFTFN